MKPLLPTLKEKKRYIGFEVVSEKPVENSHLIRALENSVLSYLGEQGAAKAGFSVIRDKTDNNRCLVRTGVVHVNEIKAAMMFISSIDNNGVLVRSLGVSGTLKGLKKRVYGEAS